MEKNWKKFERVVAAIHVAEAQGATVTWNEDIDGRQFDVVIRFKFQFYDYMVLIECKDLQGPVPVKEVEAFVTKSKDTKANKAIMVSSNGFQSGAKEKAQKHNVELFTLTQIQEMPEDLFTDEVVSVLIVWPEGFVKTDPEESLLLSNYPNKLMWEINNVMLTGHGDMPLVEILKRFVPLLAPVDTTRVPTKNPQGTWQHQPASKEKQQTAIVLLPRTKVQFPFSEEWIPVKFLVITYWMASIRLMKPTLLDLTIYKDLGLKYDYKNVLTDEHTIVDSKNLPLGVDTKLEAGKFYSQATLKFFFYCEKVFDTQAFMCLVESYQHGQLVQASFSVPLPEANPYYMEVTDADEIERLRWMYDRYKSGPRK